MNSLNRSRPALSACVTATFLIGCTQTSGITLAQTLNYLGARPSSYRVVYNFGASPDGSNSLAALINVNGTLYGTTSNGGSHGGGTVFSVTPSGVESVLHSFGSEGSGVDGSEPFAGLRNVHGTLYGTTFFGGAACSPCGTVFSITTAGVEKVLYSFKGNPDGRGSESPVLNVKGVLYGTTAGGGTNCEFSAPNGCGTVFKVTTTGVEKVLYAFASVTDGTEPISDLIDIKGTLYGTTFRGGSSGTTYNPGYGTIYTVTKRGVHTILHNFGYVDGSGPSGKLARMNGTIYGTTDSGGSGQCYVIEFMHHKVTVGCGTVFSLTPTGGFKKIYDFAPPPDAGHPVGGLIKVNGTLYGTSFAGGSGGCYSGYGHVLTGCGAVFSVSPSGQEIVLYSFQGGTDGEFPEGGLIDVNGTLYGTTTGGGTNGNGTVFAVVP